MGVHELDEDETCPPRGAIGRSRALAILDDAFVPANSGLTAGDWPIGAAMLQFPPWSHGRTTVRDAGPEFWHRQLRRIKREGFDTAELPSSWLPIGDMRTTERTALGEVLSELELGICATSVVRKSIISRSSANETSL